MPSTALVKAWYKRELQQRLLRVDVYQPGEMSWDAYKSECAVFCANWGFTPGLGVPYLYGIWKSKKSKWRHIVGVSKEQEEIPGGSKPAHPLDQLHSLLVKCFNQVLKVLKEMDLARRAKGGCRAFWIVESVQQFAEEIRLGAKEWGDLPLATVDFEEMYTNLQHEWIWRNAMAATAEAFEYVAAREGVRLSEVRLNGTSWVTSPIQNGYTQQEFATLLQYTLVSCVLRAGSQLLKQVRGLPMGVRPAPPN